MDRQSPKNTPAPAPSEEPLQRIEGGALEYVSNDSPEIDAGEEACFLTRPKIDVLAESVLLYGASNITKSYRERPRILRACWGDETLELASEASIEALPPGALCGMSLAARPRDKRIIKPGAPFDVIVKNGDLRAELLAVLVVGELDGEKREAATAMHRVEKKDAKRSFTIPGRKNKEPYVRLDVENLFTFRSRIRRIEILTDAEPGDLFVEDVKVGKDSQFVDFGRLPAEYFCRSGGAPFVTDALQPGMKSTVCLANASTKHRTFSCALYVDPKPAPQA